MKDRIVEIEYDLKSSQSHLLTGFQFKKLPVISHVFLKPFKGASPEAHVTAGEPVHLHYLVAAVVEDAIVQIAKEFSIPS